LAVEYFGVALSAALWVSWYFRGVQAWTGREGVGWN